MRRFRLWLFVLALLSLAFEAAAAAAYFWRGTAHRGSLP